jgi:hypothetical protein
MCVDVKNVYLGIPMDSFEYLCIPDKLTPHEIIAYYTLLPLVTDGHIYIEVKKACMDCPNWAY